VKPVGKQKLSIRGIIMTNSSEEVKTKHISEQEEIYFSYTSKNGKRKLKNL
jgi:hypothetical protein